jgi:hypothetical protein
MSPLTEASFPSNAGLGFISIKSSSLGAISILGIAIVPNLLVSGAADAAAAANATQATSNPNLTGRERMPVQQHV